ncbi:MAG: TetR/AcrR family transcriptional regulator [Bacteroidales bacterium]|nr:TetR/AcrR family transcriptional regulator [Bacteroidales bacterium]
MTENFTAEERRLLTAIYPIIVEKGLKSTTMDLVAHRLGMSKRTLYEIFESKTAMITGALALHAMENREKADEIMRSAPNVLVALIRIFEIHRRDLERININFFKDMDRLYHDMRDKYEHNHEEHRAAMEQLYQKGISEGVFRDDVNFRILSRMMEIQAESLKRMEDLFPPEISLVEIFDTMSLGFLRSIASEEGHRMIDRYLADRKASLSLTNK